ncbi:MAG: hypothetical protein SFV55_20660 [Haliscomenobacter sp.]|uniref:hypothetical protein n=1 Tax=Haliscomenobacter sp. TaxID=2717303 RepID=UPI0029AE619D|nr:hypothetical protein [Haliscomenobacter sp.]MDX2070853.1 hypothetical protein [Haliscomenobacter sp.]
MKLIDLLNKENYLEESYLGQLESSNVQGFLHEINNAFILIQKQLGQKAAESFVPRFIEFLVNRFAQKDEILNTDMVHSSLGYLENNNFYQTILEYLTDKDYLLRSAIDTEQENKFLTIFQSHLASIYRRKGNLEIASELLATCEKRMESDNNGQVDHLKTLSLIEYELAYIYYLQGKGLEAYDFFGQSANHAFESNHPVGEWISKCTQHRVGYLFEIEEIKVYEDVNSQALFIFEKLSKNNSLAERWVTNCILNSFRVAFYKGDKTQAEYYYAQMQQNDWPTKYGVAPISIQSMKARLLIVQESFEEAIEAYKFLPQNKLELDAQFQEFQNSAQFYSHFEGIAEYYLELGNAFSKLNQKERAIEAFRLGLEVPDYGNVPFKNKIQKRLLELN